MGKDPFAQSQFLSCVLEWPPQYSVLLHLAKALLNRCARLVACLAHLGLGVQGLAGASWQFHQTHHHTRQPHEGRDIHGWSPRYGRLPMASRYCASLINFSGSCRC